MDAQERAHEHEYDKFMKGLVDTSFEEGQYEAGITLLDQMRSTSFKPVP